MKILLLLKPLITKVREIAYRQGLIADYVIEQGTIGIWEYEKWNSGKAKCWGTDYNHTSINQEIGYDFLSNQKTTYFPEGLFVEAPRCFVANDGIHGADTLNVITIDASMIRTRFRYPVRYDDVLDWPFSILAIGKWKSGGGTN